MLFILILFNSCSKKELTINYYDDDNLIVSKLYKNNNIKLEKYEKQDYAFIYWYLDKDFTIPYDSNKIEEYFNNKTLNLYAKMEIDMTIQHINVIGMVDNKMVLNPTFSWNKMNDNESYNIRILNNKDEEIVSLTTSEYYYSIDKYLDRNSSYKFELTNNTDYNIITLLFNTIDYQYNKQKIVLNNPYMSNMVIQRNVENIISGITSPNEVVILELDNNKYYGVSDEKGNFNITLPSQKASTTPKNIKISNGIDNIINLDNILFGDVYLFAGQSNMQWPTKDSDFKNSDVTSAVKSNLRFFCQDVVTSSEKLESTKNSRWFSIDNNNYQSFSAIAFMTGSILASSIGSDVPIGIITAYQGDTNIANWMGVEYYQGSCSTKYLHYNAMVYPLRHTKLSGVVWYQGCNNSAQGGDYKDLLLKLFENYRDLFNSPNMPFFVIGLCCYDGDSGNNYDFSYVRESQALACNIDSNAYFISTCDNGDPTYIHPRTKRYICERVSKSIQSVIYKKQYYSEGPSYKEHIVNNNIVTIYLNNSDGLFATGDITNLYLAGSDGKYYLCDNVKIINNTIVCSSSLVNNPVYIKYGFGKSPFVNIYNKDNFTITPFRTDDLNTNIDLFEYNDLTKYNYHPNGSNMNINLDTNNNLVITKANDGKTYGSIQLDYYGMIAYNPTGFRLSVIGTNSNANISLRFIEGSYEIWAYKFVDNFTGLKTFELTMGDFSCVYNKQDNIMDTQKINYVELMVESNKACSITLTEARFIKIEKTTPLTFNINSVTETNDEIIISSGKSTFADSYNLIVSKTNIDPLDIIYQNKDNNNIFNINKNIFEKGIPYYIYLSSSNELGTTNSTNNGYVFYLKDDSKVIICNFDFNKQSDLESYIQSSMDVNSGLSIKLENEGIKIISSGAGWQQFIFKIDTSMGKNMTKLNFKADFNNYKGTVVLQLADTSWNVYTYNLDLTKQMDGTYTIDFSKFLNGNTPFTNQTLMWIMFNFNDNVGNGYILFDDCSISK